MGTAELVGYCDSDLAGDIDTRKSTTGTLFFLGKCLVSWQSLKQRVVALSSYEAEYITATTAATQAIWMVRLLGELLGKEQKVVELKVDNKSALALARNPSLETAWQTGLSVSPTSTLRTSSPTSSRRH
jgi:hypothetical protein